MHTQISEAITSLNQLATALNKHPNGDVFLSDSGGGWNAPPFSPNILASSCYELVVQLETDAPTDLSADDDHIFGILNQTLYAMIEHLVPNIPSQSQASLPGIHDGLLLCRSLLSRYLSFRAIERGDMPAALSRKLMAAKRDLELLIPDKEEFRHQITEIRQSYEAAEALPTTLSELQATQSEVRSVSTTSSELLGRIRQAEEATQHIMADLKARADESVTLVKQASEAYRVTTTIGLAAAFDERAKSLNKSMYVWVAGLAISLTSLLVIGSYRLAAMKEALAATEFDAARIWIQIVLSILSVAAPVWFGWISTKQIGQRFRLAEDYAFKASISKAYEGYRREALSLNPEFANSLFASALKRLDEPPLRLIEADTHGSPIHELANSSLVDKVLEKLPGKNSSTRTSEGEPEKTDER